MVLIPAAVDKLRIPVVASGGIADGRGFVAALALGAEGVSLGTRFLLTRESPMPETIKQRYLEASERDTALVCKSLGDSTRVLRNALTDRILAHEASGDISHDALLDLAGSRRWVEAAQAADPDGGAFAAGMAVGLIHDVPSCAEAIERIVAQARAIVVQRLAGIVD